MDSNSNEEAGGRKKASNKKSTEQQKIDELSGELSFLSRRVTRRTAISAGAGIAAGVVGGLIVGGAAGYFAGTSGTTGHTTTVNNTVTINNTVTASSTAMSTTSSIPSTSVSTAVSTSSSLSSAISSASASYASGAAGPGIDYYYDSSLKGSTVNWVSGVAPEYQFILPLVPLFEQETGITINNNYVANADSPALPMFAAGASTYDIVDAGWFGAEAYGWYNAGYLDPIQNYLDLLPSGFNLSDILPIATEAWQSYAQDPNGVEQIGWPKLVAEQAFAYRTDAFSSQGIAEPLLGEVALNNGVGSFSTNGTDLTWEDLTTNIYPKLQSPPKQYAYMEPDTIAGGYTGPLFPSKIWAYNVDIFTKDFTPNFTSSEVMEGANMWLKVISTYNPEPGQMQWSNLYQAAGAGTLASSWNAAGVQPEFFYSGSTVNPSNWKTCYQPKGEGGAHPIQVLAEGTVINKHAKNPKGGFSFMSFLASPRIQALLASQGLGPLRQSILKGGSVAGGTNYGNVYGVQQAAWLASAQPLGTPGADVVWRPGAPKVPGFTTIYSQLGTQLGNVLSGQQTMAQCMQWADSAFGTLLKNAGFTGVYTNPYGQ